MLSLKDATEIVHKSYPDGQIQSAVSYKNIYLFQIFNDRPLEEQWDPFFSVNKTTGEFKDFCVLTDGNMDDITLLFQKAKRIP